MSQKKLALSLSGGGARSMCYLGAVNAFKDKGIEVNSVLAHSGAAILLCYLSGFNDRDEVIYQYSRFRLNRFTSLNPWANAGIINSKKLHRYLSKVTKASSIQEQSTKTFITISDLTDFMDPKKLILESGDLAEAAVISSSIPPLMPLYKYQDKVCGDGAFTSLYSAQFLRDKGAEVVVGMFPDALKFSKLPQIALNQGRMITSLIARANIIERQTQPVDLEIRDFDCTVGLNDFHRAKEAYNAGYKRGLELLPKLKKLLL